MRSEEVIIIHKLSISLIRLLGCGTHIIGASAHVARLSLILGLPSHQIWILTWCSSTGDWCHWGTTCHWIIVVYILHSMLSGRCLLILGCAILLTKQNICSTLSPCNLALVHWVDSTRSTHIIVIICISIVVVAVATSSSSSLMNLSIIILMISSSFILVEWWTSTLSRGIQSTLLIRLNSLVQFLEEILPGLPLEEAVVEFLNKTVIMLVTDMLVHELRWSERLVT